MYIWFKNVALKIILQFDVYSLCTKLHKLDYSIFWFYDYTVAWREEIDTADKFVDTAAEICCQWFADVKRRWHNNKKSAFWRGDTWSTHCGHWRVEKILTHAQLW